VDAALEKKMSVDDYLGKPVNYRGLQEAAVQQMYKFVLAGQAEKAAEIDAILTRVYFYKNNAF